MTSLCKRLDEALGDWAKRAPTEGGYSEEHISGVPCVRLAWISDDGYAHEVDPLILDAEGIAKLCVVIAAARAYRDLLANGRVVDNTVMAWPGEEGLGAGKYLVVEIDPTEEVTGE